MSPEIAVEVLRRYRREFTARRDGERPYSAISVLAFASDDAEAVLEFEAAWSLTMQNLARGIREPLRPEEVRAYAGSEAFRRAREAQRHLPDERMVTGTAADVVGRLRALRAASEVDEVVLVTPSLDRERRAASFRSIADAWRAAD
jgi:alkanesulfonate monooxygenase SsuD/methylene tetrahydromethanopterin reductase-like flavin-dependent oxidoreductase (luciferase family)